jgi:peptidase E
MNTAQIEVDAQVAPSPVEIANPDPETVIKMLHDLELAYVGGGTGNVIF